MATKQISNNTKELLKEAVHDMAILTDDGMHPTTALVKVAKTYELTPDHTRLVGRAYNTAHTADVREKGAGILEKLETTPIADCEAAVAKLENIKVAAAEEVADIYKKDIDHRLFRGLAVKIAEELDLQDFRAQFEEKKALLKTAGACLSCEAAKTSVDKLLSDKNFIDGEIKKLAGRCEYLKDQLEASLFVTRKYAATLPPEKLVATKIAAIHKYGKNTIANSDEAFEVTITSTKITGADPALLERCGGIDKLVEEIQQAIEGLNKCGQARNIIESALKKKAGVKVANPSALTGNIFASALNDAGGALGYEVAPVERSRLAPTQTSVPARHIHYGIKTPAHQKTLTGLRTKSIINDMLSNDEIISQYTPEQVFNTYNLLMATAPGAMRRPMVARSFMREALAKGGVLGTYDITPLMSYDKDIGTSEARAGGADNSGILTQQATTRR